MNKSSIFVVALFALLQSICAMASDGIEPDGKTVLTPRSQLNELANNSSWIEKALRPISNPEASESFFADNNLSINRNKEPSRRITKPEYNYSDLPEDIIIVGLLFFAFLLFFCIPLELAIMLFDPFWRYSRMPAFRKYSKDYDRSRVNIMSLMIRDYTDVEKYDIKKWPETKALTIKPKFLSVQKRNDKIVVEPCMLLFEDLPDKVRITFRSSYSVTGSLMVICAGILLLLCLASSFGTLIFNASLKSFLIFIPMLGLGILAIVIFVKTLRDPDSSIYIQRDGRQIESTFHSAMVLIGIEQIDSPHKETPPNNYGGAISSE